MGSICWIDNDRATIIQFLLIFLFENKEFCYLSPASKTVQLWVMKLKKQFVFLAEIVRSICFDVGSFRVEQARLARVADQIAGFALSWQGQP